MHSYCTLHDIIDETKVSPIVLGIGAYIQQTFGSESVINLLANMGMCPTYHNFNIFETSLIMTPDPNIRIGAFAKFAFENCDFNVNTTDGHGTFHNMACIECA